MPRPYPGRPLKSRAASGSGRAFRTLVACDTLYPQRLEALISDPDAKQVGYFCPTPRKGLIGKVFPTSLNRMRELAKTASAHFDQSRPPITIWPDVMNQWFADRGSRLSTLIKPVRGVGQK